MGLCPPGINVSLSKRAFMWQNEFEKYSKIYKFIKFHRFILEKLKKIVNILLVNITWVIKIISS